MTILIVDDNEPNLYQLQVLLGGSGYQVVTAVHGVEALAKARQNPPDLIVSDILMPVMDGFALCREWKKDEHLRQIPFVFYTATYTDERDREFALSLGAEQFLVKPEEPEVFLQTIREVLQQVQRPPAPPAPPAANAPARLPVRVPQEEESSYLKQYNEALIRKLEVKMQQLEQANRQLERDITERKRAEEQLHRVNRALQTISECNQVMVRATEELDLNNQICRILVEHGGFRLAWVGYAEQDEARSVRPVAHAGHDEGYLAEARITWADTERGRGPAGMAVRSGTVCVVRHTSTEPDYKPWRDAAMRHGFASSIGLPLAAGGHVLGVLNLYAGEVDAFDDAEVKLLTGLANDLAYGIQALRVRAAHVQAEKSLIRLRKAVDASGEVIFMTDQGGIITFINPEFTRVYGYAEAEVVGKTTPRILKSGTLQPGDYANFWKTILEKRVVRGEIVNKTKNGRLVSVHSSVNPVLDEGGHIAGFLAIQRDVSERKQLEQQFRQAQKMEALGQLAGGVAHDFNNLLTVISGYSELLADGLGHDGPRLEQVKQIQNAAGRAASLTRQLLAFGRRQTMAMEVMDVNSAVARVEKMLHRVIGENIELITRPARELGHVKADPGQVEQVIINLAINARDAMPQGGKLIIATANVEVSADDSRCRSGLKPGDYVSLTVADTGTGIDPKIKANIFEPFFTTKERGKGTGLGLATVYGIVQQSGGFVSVETEVGSGSTFQILLPRVGLSLTPPTMEPAAMTHRPCTETVLVVEDEPPLRAMVRGILESCGYRVLEAGHGGEALSICERHEAPIDLVLTDVVMPQMGGPELALRLASRWPKIRILYMTGYTDDANPDAALPEAKRTFITKPFTPKALMGKVREALDAK
jgi:PAS domain S-box-containing protein